jgi:hypothetical protein
MVKIVFCLFPLPLVSLVKYITLLPRLVRWPDWQFRVKPRTGLLDAMSVFLAQPAVRRRAARVFGAKN